MAIGMVTYRDWQFEVERDVTSATYSDVAAGSADTCGCRDCQTYIAYRDKLFPPEVQELFGRLGVDYRKEVEITTFEEQPDGLNLIGGWFHFKGKIVSGKNCRIPTQAGDGFTLDLMNITESFSIGFAASNDLTFFEDPTGLVQIEFMAHIPRLNT